MKPGKRSGYPALSDAQAKTNESYDNLSDLDKALTMRLDYEDFKDWQQEQRAKKKALRLQEEADQTPRRSK